jgi:hypothetical protein
VGVDLHSDAMRVRVRRREAGGAVLVEVPLFMHDIAVLCLVTYHDGPWFARDHVILGCRSILLEMPRSAAHHANALPL